MGATLPAVSRWVETTPEGVAWLGWFYAGNIAGAVLRMPAARASTCCAYYDMATATFVAVGLNVMVAALAPGCSASRARRFEPALDMAPSTAASPADRRRASRVPRDSAVGLRPRWPAK